MFTPRHRRLDSRSTKRDPRTSKCPLATTPHHSRQDVEKETNVASKRNPEDYGAVIGARIKRLRESKGYAARKVGASVGSEGVDASQVYRWESGLNMPTLYNLAEIADVLGCSLDYLAARTDDPTLVPVIATGNLQPAAEAVAESVQEPAQKRRDLRRAAQRKAAGDSPSRRSRAQGEQ